MYKGELYTWMIKLDFTGEKGKSSHLWSIWVEKGIDF